MKHLLLIMLAAVLTLCVLPAPAAEADSVGRLVVNNVDVFSAADMQDVLGDGTVSFDRETGVLTLRDAKLTQGYSMDSWAEHPLIFFDGQLTIHLCGSNVISAGAETVMEQELRLNAIYGQDLTITAEPDALLEVQGMLQLNSFTQEGGAVSVTMQNDHPQIVKWALYAYDAITLNGGTLTAASTGAKRGGALMLDEGGTFRAADGALFAEGDEGPGETVPAPAFEGELSKTSRDFIKVTLPEAGQAGL